MLQSWPIVQHTIFWGKSKSVSFSRVHVCVKAKLTLVSFFYFFYAPSPNFISSSGWGDNGDSVPLVWAGVRQGQGIFRWWEPLKSQWFVFILINHSLSRCHQPTKSACGLEPTWCLSTPSTMLRSCSRRTASRFVNHVDVVNDGTSILYLCLEVF